MGGCVTTFQEKQLYYSMIVHIHGQNWFSGESTLSYFVYGYVTYTENNFDYYHTIEWS